jgi:ATP-binding cassette subfamily B protein
MKLWVWLLRQLDCKKDIIRLLSFKIINVFLGVLFALWMRKTIDDIYVSSNRFVMNAIVFIVVILLQIIVSSINYYLIHRLEYSLEHKLKSMMMTTILNKDYSEVSNYHSGEIMNRYASDLNKISQAISKQLPNMITMFFRIIVVMIVIGVISPLLSIILCVGGIVTVFCAFIVKRILKPMTRKVNKCDDILKSQVQECLESLLVIHSFRCEASMNDIHQEKLNQYIDAQLKKSYFMNVFETSLAVAVQGAYVLGFLWAVYGVMHNNLTIGSISAIISLVGQIKNPFVSVSVTLPQLIVLGTNIERIQSFIREDSVIPRQDVSGWYTSLQSICLEHVSFSYGDKEVLKDFNLKIQKNETIAFVGYSGVGKTTVLKLIMNLYSLNQGRIYLQLENETKDISELGYGLMTYVPQDYGLMSGSIYEAVAFGCKEINKEKVQWACEKACIHEEIMQLKNGYDTLLKEQGKSLSGGQMQRLSLARAIYSDCPIMLLDEVTSSLHPSLEQKVIQSLKTLKDKTIIIVTHRKEVLDICDRVVDFDEVSV